jgi:chromosome segregation ATPase
VAARALAILNPGDRDAVTTIQDIKNVVATLQQAVDSLKLNVDGGRREHQTMADKFDALEKRLDALVHVVEQTNRQLGEYITSTRSQIDAGEQEREMLADRVQMMERKETIESIRDEERKKILEGFTSQQNNKMSRWNYYMGVGMLLMTGLQLWQALRPSIVSQIATEPAVRIERGSK